jgi:uncharacterized protein
MEIIESFLGTGWSFPPRFDKAAKSVRTVSDEQDIRESLEILLSTRPGERIMLPEYGCPTEELLFGAVDLTFVTSLRDTIRNAILLYEPRIDLIDVLVDTDSLAEGRISILLDYRIRATNSRMNMVYPFYRIEGNDLSYVKTGEI